MRMKADKHFYSLDLNLKKQHVSETLLQCCGAGPTCRYSPTKLFNYRIEFKLTF